MNPLRIEPTRTMTLQRAFQAEMQRRIKLLKIEVRQRGAEDPTSSIDRILVSVDWWSGYLSQFYIKGLQRVYTDLRKKPSGYEEYIRRVLAKTLDHLVINILRDVRGRFTS